MFLFFSFGFKEYEDRQLLWEQHEVELERKIAKLERQQKDFYEAAKKVSGPTLTCRLDKNLILISQFCVNI